MYIAHACRGLAGTWQAMGEEKQTLSHSFRHMVCILPILPLFLPSAIPDSRLHMLSLFFSTKRSKESTSVLTPWRISRFDCSSPLDSNFAIAPLLTLLMSSKKLLAVIYSSLLIFSRIPSKSMHPYEMIKNESATIVKWGGWRCKMEWYMNIC
jgi:hypothetical protein